MISVILCGGAGSRLWPVSRELHPKPFITLPDRLSLVQKACLAAAGLPRTREIMTITNKALHFKIAGQFKAAGEPKPTSYILEPFGRNTGPAIAAAALEIRRRFGEEQSVLIMAADHLIADQPAFARAVAQGLELAESGRLVTFGITPSGPETGFGYIQARGTDVLRFVEKPGPDQAREYLESGDFLWNAGIFCFTAGAMLEELASTAPDLLASVTKCLKVSREAGGADTCLELDSDTFAQAPNISIDYAVMEKSSRVSVVPCDIGWSDIGSWTSLCALYDLDEDGNHHNGGKTVLHDVKNCDIHGRRDRLIAAVGVRDLLIVDTADALLVADKSRDQEVKVIYERLKAENNEAYKSHRTVYRPWGSYTVLERGPHFQIKRLEIKPGGALSLQLHRHRSEHWVVVSGMAEVTCADKVFFVSTNESTYIKAGLKHRVANNGFLPLVMIEVQSGEYLGEDDIVRFEDIYGRTPSAEDDACGS